MNIQRKAIQGLTLIEVLVVLMILILLAAIILPSLAKAKGGSRINCINNVKQIGLSFRVWSGDNNDKFPMQVSTNLGGSMELTLAGDVTATFRAMSNELSTSRVLICPGDKSRLFNNSFAELKRESVSYFIGVDCNPSNPQSLLTGDRNVTNGTKLLNGLLELSTNNPPGWTDEIHQKKGNIGCADGSVQQLTSPDLQTAIAQTGVTNRIVLP